MAEHDDNKSINARSDNLPVVEPKGKGGRHSKKYYNADVTEVLAGTAKTAARILQAHINQAKGKKTLKPSLQRACEYVIDHTIGKARQKVELSGGVLAYGELAKSADKLDDKPRPVLSEALDIAHKYQAAHLAAASDPGSSSGKQTPDNPDNAG